MFKAEVTRDDILSRERYSTERKQHAKRISALKATRRVAVGPDATFYFESWDTMWFQIQEMLEIYFLIISLRKICLFLMLISLFLNELILIFLFF